MDQSGMLRAEGDTPAAQRRRKARMSEVDEETQLRRRAQNRESQQAYRQRKEEYVQDIQNRIVTLHLQHRELWQSYVSQSKRVEMLREMLADLNSEVTTLKQQHVVVSALAPGAEMGFLPDQQLLPQAVGNWSALPQTASWSIATPGETGSKQQATAGPFMSNGMQGPSKHP